MILCNPGIKGSFFLTVSYLKKDNMLSSRKILSEGLISQAVMQRPFFQCIGKMKKKSLVQSLSHIHGADSILNVEENKSNVILFLFQIL